MEVKLSEQEIRAIAAEIARLLREEPTANTTAGASPSKNRVSAATDLPTPKPRASRVLTPEEAVAEFPSLTVRTIKRAITEGRLEASEPGETTVRRTELKRFVQSRA